MDATLTIAVAILCLFIFILPLLGLSLRQFDGAARQFGKG
jgi:hypothetical protein